MLDGFQADILHPALQGLYADAIQRGTQAKQSADQLWQQMQEQMQAPTPQMDPQRQFISTLMGGLSQALAPQLGGQQQAQTGIAEVNADLRNKRAMSLQALHTRYGEAAQQAEQAGDNERAIKMRNAELKVNKELADIARTQHLEDTKASDAQRMKELRQQGQNTLDATKLAGQNALAVANANNERAIQIENAKVKASYAQRGLREDGVTPIVAVAHRKDVSMRVQQLVSAKKAEGASSGDIRAAIKPEWLQRTDTDGVGNSGMIAYAKRLRQPPIKEGFWGGGKLFNDDEVIDAVGTNFIAALPRQRAPEDYKAMYRAARAAGVPSMKADSGVRAYAAEIMGDTWIREIQLH